MDNISSKINSFIENFQKNISKVDQKILQIFLTQNMKIFLILLEWR